MYLHHIHRYTCSICLTGLSILFLNITEGRSEISPGKRFLDKHLVKLRQLFAMTGGTMTLRVRLGGDFVGREMVP